MGGEHESLLVQAFSTERLKERKAKQGWHHKQAGRGKVVMILGRK